MADLRDFTGKNRKFTGTIGEKMSTGTTGERDTSFGGGTLRFNSTTNLLEYYTGTEWKSIDAPPTITFVSVDGGADTTSGQVDNEASGNVTIQVKGSLFDTTGGNVTFIGTSETLTPATTTRNNSGLFTCILPASSFDTANSPYTVKVTNGSGLSAELVAGISADQSSPAFTTSAGTLGTINDSTRASYTLSSAAATDADGDTITYSISVGALPPGLSISSSTGVISGTATAVVSNTTSTFTVSAATAASTSTRQFSITVNAPVVQSFTSSGTFTVPAGITTVDVLVVAGGGSGAGGGGGYGGGGGGGAGGLIFMPAAPVTPGGSIPITVGLGGAAQGGPFSGVANAAGQSGQDSVFNSPTGVLTAKGGGSGGGGTGGVPASTGKPGGSGGGAGGQAGAPGGSATQPGQPGNSGTFGFGNAGGTAPTAAGAGGGGAGGAGRPISSPDPVGGTGGAGRSYDISGSSVIYAGGGGGGAHGPLGVAPGAGGPGGGGIGGSAPGAGSTSGATNRGGGGGGGGENPTPNGPAGQGGPGIVIVKY